MPSKLVRRRPVLTAALAVVGVVFSAVASAPAASAAPEPVIHGTNTGAAIPGQYLVQMKESAALSTEGVAARATTLAGRYQGKVGFVYEHEPRGFSVAMSEQEAKRLAADPQVERVEQDQRVRAADTQENPPSWGIDRIDQRNLPLNLGYSYENTASNVTAYILDSGLRISHSEFEGRARWGWDFISNTPNANDCTGHGTHVAGTIGGKNYGIAKGVHLVGLRVFDCSGFGSASAIAAAVNWVTATAVKPAVANISVEYVCNPAPCNLSETAQMVDGAIANSINSGIPYVVAAGNHNLDACTQPIAHVAHAITVGATESNDARAPYSNWGPCVNIWAPGSGILSAWHTSDTATRSDSGSSMAVPHVAGAVALILGRGGTWATATPQAITGELVNTMATNNIVTNIAGTNSTSKLLYTAPPPAAGGSSMAVARNADGRLTLFGVNKQGQLFHRSQDIAGVNTWSNWAMSVNTGWYSVAAEPNFDGRIGLVGLRNAQQDALYRRQATVSANQWQAWKQLDGSLTAGAMANSFTGRLELFGVNVHGQVFHRAQLAANSESWSAWTAFGFGSTVRAVAAEANLDGRAQVFALTNNGQIWTRWQTGTQPGAAWSPWVRLDGTLKSIAVARNDDGRLQIFGVNGSGQVFHRTQTAPGAETSWQNWVALDGTMSSVAAETNADGRTELFAVNNAGEIWHRWENAPGTGSYSAWFRLDGQLRP